MKCIVMQVYSVELPPIGSEAYSMMMTKVLEDYDTQDLELMGPEQAEEILAKLMVDWFQSEPEYAGELVAIMDIKVHRVQEEE
jgi:hypothetical protein